MIEEKIIKLVAKHLQVSESKVTPESDLFDDLGADSLDSIEMVLQLESNFDIEVSDEEIDGIRQVKDIIRLVEDLA